MPAPTTAAAPSWRKKGTQFESYEVCRVVCHGEVFPRARLEQGRHRWEQVNSRGVLVEFEQGGREQAQYGSVLVVRLALDLTPRFGRGFSKSNLYQMRNFYATYHDIFQTAALDHPNIRNG